MKKVPSKKSAAPGGASQRPAKDAPQSPFPIAGIGASAGGLEALEQFLGVVPEKSGIAYVIVQHLDPTHKGIMPELLQHKTSMKVVQVKDRMKVQPDCVYVIPPNRDMSILHGTLHLFEPQAPRGMRLPIDFFFRSLAEDLQERSIGVILSGMGSDGTLGLRAIKEQGGLVAVQDPASARFDGMPKSAIDAGLADLVGRVELLPEKIIAFLQHARHIVRPDAPLKQAEKSALDKIVVLLRNHCGNDFSQYKSSTLYRRIERRMGLHQIAGIDQYVKFLLGNSAELELLFKELLIGVTSFFRDGAAWAELKDEQIPALLGDRPFGHVVRAWVPACSTGEEAYSLAMVFREVLEKAGPRGIYTMQIFATDLDRDAIDQARRGEYAENIVADVSAERLHRFFTREGNIYRVNKEIRDMVIFAQQNIIKDPPFTRLDIVSCRNLLIYLKPELQKKLIPLFHYALNPGGVLFLGNAETIGDFGNLFAAQKGKVKIYRKLATGVATPQVEFPLPPPNAAGQKEPEAEMPAPSVQNLADRIILEKYAPAAVLVNVQGDILYISGRTGRYLEPPAGKANWNVFAMAREGLRTALTGAFRKAVQEKKEVIQRGIEVRIDSGMIAVDLTVSYIEKPDFVRALVMVLFRETEIAAGAKSPRGKKVPYIDTKHVEELEKELQQSRNDLQITMEEMQTSQEELKATNEELQSANEELQSTNEELTTSKEELQSLNEELQTVNSEQAVKMAELSQAYNDINNLLNSTDISTVFLDKEMCIRRFTTGANRLFKLNPVDVGRPLTDIATYLIYDELEEDAMEVLRSLATREKEVGTRDGRSFKVRIMPYRTQEDIIDGVVITFTDITAVRGLETKLQDSARRSAMIDEVPLPIVALSPQGEIIELNREAEREFGIKREEVTGRNYFELLVPEPVRGEVREKTLKALGGIGVLAVETPLRLHGGVTRKFVFTVNPLFKPNGEIYGVIAVGPSPRKMPGRKT